MWPRRRRRSRRCRGQDDDATFHCSARHMRRLLPLLLVLSAQAALGAEELRLVLERKSLTATWRTYHQFIDGVEVVGTAVVERVDGDGNVREVARDVTKLRGEEALLPLPRALSIHS